MKTTITQFFHNYSNIGVDKSMSFIDTVKIRILNLQAGIGLMGTLIFLFISLIQLKPDVPILFISCLAASVPIILHYYRKGSWARVYWLFGFPLVIYFISILYGTNNGVEYVYINFLVIGLMLFNKWPARIAYILFIMIIAYTSMNLGSLIQSPLAEHVKETDQAIIFITIILAMSASVIQLMHLMNYYVKQLYKTNSELRQKTEALEDYVYASSHNLKTPLRQITSFIDLLGEELNGETKKEVKDYMAYIKDGSITMYETIEDLMEKSESEEMKSDS